jgi:DNA-binding GntR family transcriptional regulator
MDAPTTFPFALQIDRRLARGPQLYEALREAILALRLKPGTPISENWICQQCDVSRTPAREALIRLAQEGLIMVFPQEGSFVAPISLKKVIEASFIREALEVSILKMAGAVWTEGDTDAAAAILQRQRLHAAYDDNPAFFTEDQNFHRYFAKVAGAEGMSTIIKDTATHLVRIRRLTHPVEGRMKQAIADHQDILEHMSAGKVDEAIAGLTRHLSRVFQALNRAAGLYPEYFKDISGRSEEVPEAMRRYLSSYVRPSGADVDAHPDASG